MIEEDKRQFSRYRIESLCEVRVGTEICKGKVVDYSNGVGVLIRKVPQLVKGAVADIVILDCEIEFRAEVVWTEDVGYHLRVGFKRLDNLKGNLKHYRLVDILLGLSKSRKTGILKIIVGSTVKRIYLDNGLKIFAVSTNTNDRLGEYLLTQGIITLEEYNQASYLVEKKGQRLGQILIELGYLKPSDLAPSVQHQVEEIIIGLFNISEGIFEFKECSLPTDEPIKLKISTANLVYKGIKRINSFPMVDEMCPPLETVFNPTRNPIPLFKSLTLEFADKKVLSYINGINPLKTILSLSHTSNFETLKSIISLLTIGLITIKGENEVPAKLPLEVIFGEPEDTQSEELVEETHEQEVSSRSLEITEQTADQKSNVETYDEMTDVSHEQDAITEEHIEMSAENVAEVTHEGETAESSTKPAEETAEQKSDDENYDEMTVVSHEQGAVTEEHGEMSAENITEETHEGETAESSTKPAEERAEQRSDVETYDEITDVLHEQGPVTEEHGEMSVENIVEEIHEQEESSVITETTEEIAEHPSSIESTNEMRFLSKSRVTITKDPDKTPVENSTEQINEEQPVTEKAGYVNETAGVSEPVAVDSDMTATTGEEAYVQMNDITSEKTSEVIIHTVHLTDDNIDTVENPRSKTKLVISIFIIIIVIGAIVPFVYEYIKMPLSSTSVTNMKNAESLSPALGKATEKATAGISQDKTSFPVFRDDAIKKFLDE